MARLGGSGSSGLRISNSNQFYTFSLRICGFTHLNPTNSRMIKTTSTMLADQYRHRRASLFPSFVVQDYSTDASPAEWLVDLTRTPDSGQTSLPALPPSQ